MRLNYLDILEQCFRDKFRGYNKEEVDTFLHLVADDYKEMAEELQKMKPRLAEMDALIQELKSNSVRDEDSESAIKMTREILKDKAKHILDAARAQADQHKTKAQNELKQLKKDIEKLRQDKTSLIRSIKESVRDQLHQFKK